MNEINSPWLKRKDWRNRRIEYGPQVGGLVYTICILFFGIPGIFALVWGIIHISTANSTEFGAAFAGLLFLSLAIGIGYIYYQGKKYKTSICNLETLPGIIGDWFKANIEVKLQELPAKPVLVKLRNTTAGSEREYIHWKTSITVQSQELVKINESKYRIPIEIYLPPDMNDEPIAVDFFSTSTAVWLLEITAEQPGIDFKALFKVPIFRLKNYNP